MFYYVLDLKTQSIRWHVYNHIFYKQFVMLIELFLVVQRLWHMDVEQKKQRIMFSPT